MITFFATYIFDSIFSVLCFNPSTSLLLFCFGFSIVSDSEFDYSLQKFYLPLILLLLQDFQISNRFGFALVWLIPFIGIIYLIKRIVLYSGIFMPFLTAAIGIFLEAVISSLILNGLFPSVFVILLKIWYTWICGIILILGLRGNRCSIT